MCKVPPTWSRSSRMLLRVSVVRALCGSQQTSSIRLRIHGNDTTFTHKRDWLTRTVVVPLMHIYL